MLMPAVAGSEDYTLKLSKSGLPEKTLKAFYQKNIYTTRDVVTAFPRKYHAYGECRSINWCTPGEYCAVNGVLSYVEKSKRRFPGARWYVTTLYIRILPPDRQHGIFFGISIMAKGDELKTLMEKYGHMAGQSVVVCGRVKQYMGNSRKMVWEMDDISQIVPLSEYHPYIHCIYPAMKGIDQDELRRMQDHFMLMDHDLVEPEIVKEATVLPFEKAVQCLHHPQNLSDISLGRERIIFDDLLYFSLSLKETEKQIPQKTEKIYSRWDKTVSFVKSLPFELTKDQKGVINKIFLNAKKGNRNNILVQGDVGCGKTIIAVAMMVYSAENGYQSVLMAPRGVLAAQHYKEISAYAESLGICCVYLHNGMKAAERKEALAKIASGEAMFIVGTHSVIGKSVKYNNLGAVITDEEHLFGVDQKKALNEKAIGGAHSLSLSATPIPRSMAQVLYGDMKDICVIRTKPRGRKEILTRRFSDRKEVFPFMLQQVQDGRQCYVVCPAIEDNEEMDVVSIDSIKDTYKDYFSTYGVTVETADGKMKKEESSAVIERFVSGKCQILISTTVIEVGVNVPNATVMVIEQAGRFGLASLHQLRGRVGRGNYQSYCCLLCADPENERIKTLCNTSDGFIIAQEDLKQRGSGNLIGTQQAGDNKYIKEMLDNPLIFQKAKKAAEICVKNGYGRWLLNEYEEHLELKEQHQEKKKEKNSKKI